MHICRSALAVTIEIGQSVRVFYEVLRRSRAAVDD
jgi:hypothetical protein